MHIPSVFALSGLIVLFSGLHLLKLHFRGLMYGRT